MQPTLLLYTEQGSRQPFAGASLLYLQVPRGTRNDDCCRSYLDLLHHGDDHDQHNNGVNCTRHEHRCRSHKHVHREHDHNVHNHQHNNVHPHGYCLNDLNNNNNTRTREAQPSQEHVQSLGSSRGILSLVQPEVNGGRHCEHSLLLYGDAADVDCDDDATHDRQRDGDIHKLGDDDNNRLDGDTHGHDDHDGDPDGHLDGDTDYFHNDDSDDDNHKHGHRITGPQRAKVHWCK